MQKLKTWALYIPLAFLVIGYTGHAVLGLLQDPEYTRLVTTLGLSGTMTMLLVYLIFPLDGAVAYFLLFGNKLSEKFPWGVLFLWAGLWPWVPRVLELKGGYEPEFSDAIIFSVMAALAYYFYRRYHTIFFRSAPMPMVVPGETAHDTTADEAADITKQ